MPARVPPLSFESQPHRLCLLLPIGLSSANNNPKRQGAGGVHDVGDLLQDAHEVAGKPHAPVVWRNSHSRHVAMPQLALALNFAKNCTPSQSLCHSWVAAC